MLATGTIQSPVNRMADSPNGRRGHHGSALLSPGTVAPYSIFPSVLLIPRTSGLIR